MIKKSEAIKNFLNEVSPELGALYNINMECQVNVSKGTGIREEGNYEGRRWVGWQDEETGESWKSFRIPYNANTEPHYEDKQLTFDLKRHAEGIGMTGWDWKNLVSRWVAFDFDSIINHESGLTETEMTEVVKAVTDIEWVTIRKSTSGTGYHLYVTLDTPLPTANHNEHAALARSILGKMSGLLGMKLESKVDICGGNMWVWHRKMKGTDGLMLVKQGTNIPEDQIPLNWVDHVKVVKGGRRKNMPQYVEENNIADEWGAIVGQRNEVEMDETHVTLLKWLAETGAMHWWDADNQMLVTHTHYLELAHTEFDYKGVFKTASKGGNLDEQNCYAFPTRGGSWTVRRFTMGVTEDVTWSQDTAGWTTCFLNKMPDLWTAARSHGGIENTKGQFVFREAENAIHSAALLGTTIKLDIKYMKRKCVMFKRKDGRIILEVERDNNDILTPEMNNWLPEKDVYVHVSTLKMSDEIDTEVANFDDLVRHIVDTGNKDLGWVIRAEGIWRDEPLTHVRVALQSQGLNPKEINNALGTGVLTPWSLVNKPFEDEYPGNRQWNRSSAQIRFAKKEDNEELNYPHWNKVLDHLGQHLTEAVLEDGWCKVNGIRTGAEYLMCWIASMFQYPEEPLPYLFFYGDQDNGKSSFHEAVELLLTKGYQRADLALTNQSGFNGELEGAIICVVEETDLGQNKTAYNKIKDWVTSKQINIRHLFRDPYQIRNTLHFVQCANEPSYCPVFPGDTRITMIHVPPLDPLDLIPKAKLLNLLEKEGRDFITAILNLELPESNSRLNIPVVDTADKKRMASSNKTALQEFLDDNCKPANGYTIKFSDFFDRFKSYLDPNEVSYWSRAKVGQGLPRYIVKGRNRKDNQVTMANVTWSNEAAPERPSAFALDESERLILVTDKNAD